MCSKIVGTNKFTFGGTGLSLLWRSVVTFAGCVFLVPIPWVIRWYLAWLIFQTFIGPDMSTKRTLPA
jgi:hypothetical protein